MSDNKDDLLAEKVFSGFIASEIMDYDSLPPHVQTMLKKTFYAGIITTFNHSEPVIESMMIGKNVEIIQKSQGDDPIRFVVMECKTEMEAKKTRSDFDLYMEAHVEYRTLLDESRVYAKGAMNAAKDSGKRQAEKKSKGNVFDFNHPAPKSTQ